MDNTKTLGIYVIVILLYKSTAAAAYSVKSNEFKKFKTIMENKKRRNYNLKIIIGYCYSCIIQ